MKEDWKDQLEKLKGDQPLPFKDNNLNQTKTKYFFSDEEKGIIKVDLIDTKAKSWAISFINPRQSEDRRLQNPRLTSAQLRRFHNDVRELEAKVESVEEKDFNRLLPMIKMIKSKVAYACPTDGRERKVPAEFRRYIEEMINNIQDINDFRAFSKCFEAVVGYFYGEGGR